ncbi:hypothetical protein ES319_A07G196100v1 [Gossypium barbadense]|uniref:Uncharacterized protein n=1 Tax=Gossypium barbadense TaxID=3634 RepID=A0A5J5V5Q7_GOSBA|nr:hypothetical protein ES319_A07G196100v1 [Gossypium barbadense]
MFVALPSTVLCFIAINSNKKFLITVLFAETKKFCVQASTIEQIAQLKAEAASREAKAQRKYDEFQL